MKLEIERRRYRAGEPTHVNTVIWELSGHRVDGDHALPLTPDEIAHLIMDGQMPYYEDRAVVRLRVLRAPPA